jgi:hypothetical protein
MFYILPYFFFTTLMINKQSLFKKIAVVIVYTCYLIFTNKFKAYFSDSNGANELFSSNTVCFYFIPDEMMEYLGIVGIIVSSVLSGYGSSQVILKYLLYPFFNSIKALI